MADRYWVGGTASWDGTAGSKWSDRSGGTGGFSVPTSADDVFFDSASGAALVTISTGNTGAKSITCTGFSGTLAGTTAISVSGSVTLVAGMTYTYTGVLSIIGTGTIVSAGKTLGSVTVNGSGITVTLGDNCTLGATRTFTLTSGALSLNNFTLSTGTFVSSNSSVRSIAFGSGNIALTSTTAAAVVLDMANATNFTWTGTGGFTRNQAATATVRFGSTSGGSATTALNLTVNAGASALTITSTSHFRSINFTGSTCSVTGTVRIYAGGLTLASGGNYLSLTPVFSETQTFNNNGITLGAATIDGAGTTLTLGSNLTVANTGTFTLTLGSLALNGYTLSTGFFLSSNSNTRSIAFGTSNIELTGTTGETLTMSLTNFSFTGTGAFLRNQSTYSTMSVNNGTAANSPNLIITGSVQTTIISSDFGSIDLSGSTGNVNGDATVHGNLTLGAVGNYGSLSILMATSGTITSNGSTLNNLSIETVGGTVTCADALTLNNDLSFRDGTLKLKDGTTNSVSRITTFSTGFKSLETTTPGVRATISDTSGTNTVTYLSIKDSNATGGAIFNATSMTNINAGNNVGWLIAGNGNMLSMFM